MAEVEALAEAAYEAMYEARPHRVKDFYEDAMGYLAQAAEAAERAGSDTDVERLMRRRSHIREVYNRQFRGIG